MISMNLHQAGALIGATLIGKPIQFRGIATDSRQNCNNKLFVALKGENFNGEDYCQQALDNGAVAVLVTNAQDIDAPQLLCDESLTAFSILAKNWAKQCQVKIVAITGSNGKTTVKNMIHSILSQNHQCSATQGNLNNEIGVPMTLCCIHPQDEFAVIEMGAAKLGDISWLVSLVNVHTAVITNISAAHIGRFGNFENIIKEKSQIIMTLSNQDYAVLPIDDTNFNTWKSQLDCKIISFGQHPDADVNILSIKDIQLPIAGKHNQTNAACAKAVALSCGISDTDIKIGLENFSPEFGRMQDLGDINGVQIINDAYNANPNSVKAAIDVLSEFQGSKTLVLGNMGELGNESINLHQQMGEYAQYNHISTLLTIGDDARNASKYFVGGIHFDDLKLLQDYLLQNWQTLGTLLVKGSRSMHLENLINALVDSEKAA